MAAEDQHLPELDDTPTGAKVELVEVSKRYELAEGVVISALERISLTIPAGMIAAITGPSGSGKSTLLHVVGAMDTADEGRVKVESRSWRSRGRSRIRP